MIRDFGYYLGMTRMKTLVSIGVALAAGLVLSGDLSAQAAARKVKTPPLDLPAYQLPRPNEVVRSVYQFAADHPEVLRYMPCFCGCNTSGHRSNADCFVKTRAANGDVTAWQEHGMVCSMCLAVGEEAKRMYEAHKTLQETRADIEQKYGNITEFRTPTPNPPAHK
jgi:hypothetical protein